MEVPPSCVMFERLGSSADARILPSSTNEGRAFSWYEGRERSDEEDGLFSMVGDVLDSPRAAQKYGICESRWAPSVMCYDGAVPAAQAARDGEAREAVVIDKSRDVV